MRLRADIPALVVVGSLSLGGCSAVGEPEPVCRPLDVTELPRQGGIWGAWMDEERFVLTDLHQSRLLVYGTSEGLVRIVNGWEGEELALNFVSPTDIERWEDGYLLADHFGEPDRLFKLDANLRPVQVLWESDVEEGGDRWRGDEVFSIDELAAAGDRLYLKASRLTGSESSESAYNEFGTDLRRGREAGSLHELAAWPGFAGERYWYGSLSDLATTGGRAGSAFALRYAPGDSFVQELVGEGRRLEAFPDLPVPFPESLRAAGGGWAGWGPLEACSYPAGLYADRDSLYILMRDATGETVVWDLHRIDPEQDAVVGKLRLPTNAPHVGLLPGRRYWVLEEASSGLDHPNRPPIRLLLLDAAAIRAGEVLSCH